MIWKTGGDRAEDRHWKVENCHGRLYEEGTFCKQRAIVLPLDNPWNARPTWPALHRPRVQPRRSRLMGYPPTAFAQKDGAVFHLAIEFPLMALDLYLSDTDHQCAKRIQHP